MSDCKSVCCSGEKEEVIPVAYKIAGYPGVSGFISRKTWYLKVVLCVVCWLSMFYAFVHSKVRWNHSWAQNTVIWFAFYTNWTLMFQCLYWSVSVYLHRQICLKQEQHGPAGVSEMRINPKLLWIHKISHIIGVIPGVMLCMIWAATKMDSFANRDGFWICDNSFKHGLNALFLLIDFYFNMNIHRFKDIWILTLYCWIYMGWNVIYIVSGGKDHKGRDRIYSIYDWNHETERALINGFFSYLGHVIFYIIVIGGKKFVMQRRIQKHKYQAMKSPSSMEIPQFSPSAINVIVQSPVFGFRDEDACAL